MRNWNGKADKGQGKDVEGFYSTYEELKLEIYEYSEGYIKGFLQYLWGIETPRSKYRHELFITGFYSTYEELKLLFCFCNIGKNDSFYSTYEELKPRRKWRGVRLPSRFYSTYEELKHSSGKSPTKTW